MFVLTGGCSDDGVPQSGDDGASAPSDGSGDGAGHTSGSAPTSGATTAGETSGASGPEDDTGDGGTTGGSEGTDTGAPPMQCESDRDCVTIDDCCTCAAQHVDDEVPDCPELCVVGKCQEQGIPEIGAVCRFGTCVFEKVSCDPIQVACDGPPPECGEGWLPSVDRDCWGGCVPAEACDVVPSCDDCPTHETCVEVQTQLGARYVCEPIAPECGEDPTCACMGEACTEPFDTCADGPDGLQCSCPAC